MGENNLMLVEGSRADDETSLRLPSHVTKNSIDTP